MSKPSWLIVRGGDHCCILARFFLIGFPFVHDSDQILERQQMIDKAYPGGDRLFSFDDLIGIVDEWEASQK